MFKPLRFVKYSGLGNDFILVDKGEFIGLFGGMNDCSKILQALCHRRSGVGADGVILYEKQQHFSVEFFNCDGSVAALCGNGLRCAAHYLAMREKIQGAFFVQTSHFLHRCEISLPHTVTCTMQLPQYIGTYTIETELEGDATWYLFQCGVPHLIKLTSEQALRNSSFASLGKALQGRSDFPEQTVNVSILSQKGCSGALIRTYERGVFEETPACGTAAMCAAAALCRLDPSRSAWELQFVGPTVQEQKTEVIEVNLGEDCTMKGCVHSAFEGIWTHQVIDE